METREFKLSELEKMISDYVEANQIGNLGTTASSNSTRTLLKNKTSIAKQLLAMLKNNPHADITPDQVTADELETMLADYETYQDDSWGCGDIDVERADALLKRIFWITKQLIEMMKS